MAVGGSDISVRVFAGCGEKSMLASRVGLG
jgi:hypothetical protein